MATVSPIRLAEALAAEGVSALSREPARTLAEAVAAAVSFLDRGRGFLAGNSRGRSLLGEGRQQTCHALLWGRAEPCPGCPLETGRIQAAGQVACAPVPDASGGVAGVVCVAASVVADGVEGWLANILEHMVSAVFVADLQFRYVYINAAYERLRGNGRDALLGRALDEFLRPEAYARFCAATKQVLARREALEEEVCTALRGRERIFLVALIPLFDAAGDVNALCCMLTERTDHRMAERELRESRRRYLAIVEDQSELVVRLDPQFAYRFLNRTMARLLGRPMKDLLGRSFLDGLPQAEAGNLRQRLAGLTPDSPVCDIRHRLILSGGEERWLNWTVRAIFMESGQLGEYQATGSDITAYWRMERELTRSEAKYRDIFEHSAEGIFQFDPQGGMVACNPALARILGYGSAEEVLLERGDLFRRIQARQEDRLEFLRLLALKERIFDFEMQVVRRDGRTVWLSVNARAVLDEGGRLSRVEGAARDITDRKRAEEERMLLVTAVDQSAEGVVIVSRDFRLEYANPAFSQIVGPGPAPGGAADLEERLAPFLGASVRKMLGLGLRWSGRVRLDRPDGEGVAEALISPVRDENGQIANYIMLVRDMTYETGLERRLRQAEKLEAIGVLAGGVAHDFNNILTPILLNTEMILGDIPWKHPLRKPLADVVRASERARDLVRQLLTFSRQGELTVGELPLSPLVKETVKLARGMIDPQVEVLAKVSDMDLTIKADPAQMHQVLMNLCLNAAQAMPEGGVLEVGLAALAEPPRPQGDCLAAGTPLTELLPGPYARLWVSDTGHGMTAEIRERIFEPFFTTKKPGQGTGMGLAAVHGIVKSCGGAVLVESAPGRGSRFEVFLPLVPRPARESVN